MADDYIYAVARIRSRELSLLSRSDIDALLSSKNYEEALRSLYDKGYGDSSSFPSIDELLSYESTKTWELVSELLNGDLSPLYVLLYPIDFHNLKAAIKTVLSDGDGEKVFINSGTIASESLVEAVKDSEFEKLPEHLKNVAELAAKTFIKTSDGQLCDIIIDQGAMAEMIKTAKASKNKLLIDYAELYTSLANIKIAVRCCKTGKNTDFMSLALTPCSTIDIEKLIKSALKGIDELYDYISLTEYSDAIATLNQSLSAFEKWCDNKIMCLISEQKANAFTVSPIAAYVLARENEIKAVRIVLYAKQSNLDEESVRERLRDMYV